MKKKDTKLNSKVTEKGSIIAISPDLNFFGVTAVYRLNGIKWHMYVAGDNPAWPTIPKEAEKYRNQIR